MPNQTAIFAKILEICKDFSSNQENVRLCEKEGTLIF